MIETFGKLSLYLALIFSILQSIPPLFGYFHNQKNLNPYTLALARPSAYGQFAFVFLAYVTLTIAFVTNDFSLAYVQANSHPSLPLIYRLTAAWGAHEGSILLWIFILNAWTIAISFNRKLLQDKNKDVLTIAIALLGLISFCFLCFLLFTSNPFLKAYSERLGNDLNPLLQDPGFVSHPPMLYAGYVGFSVAFAITLAALIVYSFDQQTAKLIRKYAVIAWCFLTLGITLGSLWAYRVLGWGGFWFWDPVENASLLPWISGTALLHVLILVEKRNMAKAWAALLAIISFALSLLGTFLVRSGVLISAHTFATDPLRGIFLLLLFAVVMILALLIYMIRMPRLASSPSSFSLLSKESGLLLNSAVLFVAMLTILIGTLYPLILDTLHFSPISVGAPYFNTVMLPLLFILMIFMGLTPVCKWQEEKLISLWQKSWKNIAISILVSSVLLYSLATTVTILSFVSLSLSIWIILSAFATIDVRYGMVLAHTGFAILVIGIMLATLLNQEKTVRGRPGSTITLGPYQFFFIDTEKVEGPNYYGIRGNFDVFKNKHHVTYLMPEKRIYPVREMVMTKVDIHPGIFRDLYLALGEPLTDNEWSLRVYYKPFVRFIWFGGLIMILGGLMTLRSSKGRGRDG